MPGSVSFTERNIQTLFGHEAAEDEDPKRLQEYYFKSTVYDQIVTDLPLRILVGHKGIGKSALLKVSIAEDASRGVLPVLIQPNDITDLGLDTTDFLRAIRNWADGLKEMIAAKVLSGLGIDNRQAAEAKRYRGQMLDFIVEAILTVESRKYPRDRVDDILRFVETPKVVVYLDDLDRGWQGRRDDVNRISALLNAVRDLSNNNKGISFKIALRSDVYYLVRTSDESTDKIEGSVIWHTWTNHQIFVLLVKRIETYFGRAVNEADLMKNSQSELSRYLDCVIEPRFTGMGKWENAPTYRVLMSLIRKRPRDLVKLCTLAARNAYGRGSRLIQTDDLRSIFEEYSQGRIQDTVNEYRSELPEIESLLMGMKPSKRERTARQGYVYSTDALMDKLGNILEQSNLRFSNGTPASKKDLAAFLYKINFLTARKETEEGIIRKYFEENRYLSSHFADFGFEWEIHPAYRWALQPSDVMGIYQTLRLSMDDSA